MKTNLSAALAVMLALSAMDAGAQDKAADRKVELAIEQQSLADALNEWAKQTGLQLVSPSSDMLNTKVAPRIKGTYSPQGALVELLKGTTLTFEWVSERAVAIRERPLVLPAALEKTGAREHVEVPRLQVAKLAAEDDAQDGANQEARQRDAGVPEKRGGIEELEEVVVTGTHLKASAPIGSPLHTYSRQDIDASGATSTAQFIELLPQNFGGGVSENTAATFVPGNGRSENNVAHGVGANLRGLGSDATLVLLNGHRLTQTGAGDFVDLSLVPISSIERIEVLTDGASAIYGADAVAGVINIVLKKRFSGLETRARYGSVTDGGFAKSGAGVTFGYAGESGGALISYDYSAQDSLHREDRPFASEPVGDLIPEKTSNDVVVNGTQQLGPVSLRYDALYSHRQSEFLVPVNVTSEHADEIRIAPTDAYSGYAAIDIPVSDKWQASVGALYSASHISSHNTTLDHTLVSRRLDKNDLSSFNASISGPLFQLQSRDVRASLGVDYRREQYELSIHDAGIATPTAELNADRTVRSAYFEALVPIIGRSDDAGTGALDLSLAVRHEDYDDFGGTTNPKLGIAWSPAPGLRLRSTYGTSFRAPSFNQLDASHNATFFLDFPDPDFTQTSVTLFQVGNSLDFEPETATSWSFGVDFSPSAVAGLRMSADYFRTKFRDRFQTPSSTAFDVLELESVYASIITRNPTPEQINAILANPGADGLIPLTGADPADTTVIIDNRAQNIGVTQVEGVDLALSYQATWLSSTWQFVADAARLLKFENQITSQSPGVDITGTLFNPPEWRARVGATIEHGRIQGSLYASFVPSYENNQVIPADRIDSWTTLDGSVAYITDVSDSTFVNQLAVRFSVQNLLDEEPPFVASTGNASVLPVGYDAANASPVGRFVNLEVNVRF